MTDQKTNPFADTDGSPKAGEEPQFFEWEKEQSRLKLNELPEDEKKRVLEYERALDKRMNS